MRLRVTWPVISFCEFHRFSRRAWGSFSRGRSMDEPHASLQLANEPHTRREKGVLCAKTVTFSNAQLVRGTTLRETVRFPDAAGGWRLRPAIGALGGSRPPDR
jgi:hypothetical protein